MESKSWASVSTLRLKCIHIFPRVGLFRKRFRSAVPVSSWHRKNSILYLHGNCHLGYWTFLRSVLAFYYPPKVKREHFSVTVQSSLFISLCVICGSYLKIRNRLRSLAPELDILSRQSAERNLRLSRTIFVTIAVSLSVLDASCCCVHNERIMPSMFSVTHDYNCEHRVQRRCFCR